MRVLAYEFALSLRRVMRRPAASFLMLATLSVSLALSLLGWSLFQTLFFQQPEFDRSGSLLRIGVTGEVTQGRIIQISRTDFAAWREAQTSFTDFAPVMLYASTFVTTDRGNERFLGANVSSEVLRMVGARPLLGRLFTADEDKLGCAPVVLLSEKMWRTRFAADEKIVGRTVVIDTTNATVVGVMPDAFRFPNAQDLWQPLGFSLSEGNPTVPVMDIVARLKPGISLAQARKEIRQLAGRLGPESMITRNKLQPIVTPFREYYLHPDMTRSAAVLFALSLVFILVSCANAANLVLIDFLGRTGEIASSLALGVPRAAAIRGLAFQLLATSLAAAAIAFVVLLAVGPYVHGAMARVTTPYWLLFTLRPHHFLMAIGLAVGSTLIALIIPAGYLACANVEHLIRRQAGTTRTTSRALWRRGLLLGQIALLTVLAVSAGLLLRSTHYVQPQRWGYDATPIIAAKTMAPSAAFPTPEVRLKTHQRLLDELEASPSVAAAGVMTVPVGFSREPDLALGRTADEAAGGSGVASAVFSAVSPHLFAALDVPFLEGETFRRDEPVTSPMPVVITAGVAQRLWPGHSAIGRALFLRGALSRQQPPLPCVVRGVLRNFQAAGPKATVNDAVYAPIQGGMFIASFLYVRGKQGVPLQDDLRAAVNRTDPRLAIYFPNRLLDVIDIELSSVHLTTRLATAYALAAVLLCVIGIYSITVSQVMQRQREFGIRMALGTDARQLWVQFARSHVAIATLGVALGMVGAAVVAKAMVVLLFGVSAVDPVTFVATAAIILIVSGASCLPSLLKLQRVNPADCLRSL